MDKSKINLSHLIHFLELRRSDGQKEKIYLVTIKNVAAKRSLFPYELFRSQPKLFVHFLGIQSGDNQKGKIYHIKIKNIVTGRSLFCHGQIQSQPKLFYSFSKAPKG